MRFALPQSLLLAIAASSCFTANQLSFAGVSRAVLPRAMMNASEPRRNNPSPPDMVVIPGPQKSFLRMAGISQQVPPEEVIPELARAISRIGYSRAYGQLHETEYLLLLRRYVHQARELQELAGPAGVISVEHCADAGPLLQVLGYRLRKPCGQKDTSLEPNGPENAFLTVDSGFPLTQLEGALQNDTSFQYPYRSSRVPSLFKPADWTSVSQQRGISREDLLDVLLGDQRFAGLYWAFSRLDPETATVLQRSVGLVNLLPYASVLEYYGTQISVRSGRVLVPGGSTAQSAWTGIVGVSPLSAGDFIFALLKQDRGWMALYFDTVARVNKAQQARFVQGNRLRRCYDALMERGTKVAAGEGSFRKAPGLLLLFSRQQWLADGQPRIPGNIELWKAVLGKRGRRVNTPEQIFEAMVASSRLDTDEGPLQVYLALSELDMARSPQRSISPAILQVMATSFAQFGSWYPIFNEFPELSEVSITRFLHVAESLDRIQNLELRGNALGIMQANIGLWQILARQGEIPVDQLDSSWRKVIDPFYEVALPVQVFNAGDKSLDTLMLTVTPNGNLSQNELIDLLAGPPQKTAEGKRIRAEVAHRMRLVMEDQRLTPIDTLLELGHGLNAMAHGDNQREKTLALAADLRQFEMPRKIFTENEKIEWVPGYLRQNHANVEMHTDLVKVIQQPASAEKLESARGQLVPFLRDTLVGLNYAYYEPPGSQILHINPLFVRSHDFSALTVVGVEHVWQPSTVFGAGLSAGGGAYLVGSLSDLPYVLAASEQNFIAPESLQALIWQEMVPSLLASATIARWWNISPRELHAVALYQKSGEELLALSATNPQLREQVLAILSERMPPQEIERLTVSLQGKDSAEEIARLLPADTFYLASQYHEHFPHNNSVLGPSNQALDKLEQQGDIRSKKVSRDFGIPHPVLAQTYGRELLSSQPFPAFAGTCDRLLGESWDSNNLYWARIADQLEDSPEALNILSPQLTRLMIAKIFASNVEDWSALSRAMRAAGDEFLQEKAKSTPRTDTTAQR
jgi:hypothetical protein